MASYIGDCHSCHHRLAQEQLPLSRRCGDPGFSVLLVPERIPIYPLTGFFIAVISLWFRLRYVSRTRNVCLDFGDPVLLGNIAFVLCNFGRLRMLTTLVIFSGLPGTGKSMLADKLARELRWPLLRIDDVVGEIPENPNVAFWDSKVAILLGLTEVQLEVGLSVIVDSVFMNKDRNHAQNIARKNHALFRPIYVFVSDENVWKERVTTRSKQLNHKDVATWEQIQHQRGHFRKWEPDTALFIDSLHSFDRNYEAVLNFVKKDQGDLKPLSDLPLVEGKYHE
jgi:predicted kinase